MYDIILLMLMSVATNPPSAKATISAAVGAEKDDNLSFNCSVFFLKNSLPAALAPFNILVPTLFASPAPTLLIVEMLSPEDPNIIPPRCVLRRRITRDFLTVRRFLYARLDEERFTIIG
jgi:hypothetical protein